MSKSTAGGAGGGVGRSAGNAATYRQVEYIDDAYDIGKDMAFQWVSKLTEAERDAIIHYTGSGYDAINNILRSDNHGFTKGFQESVKAKIDALTSALDKARLPESAVVYRRTTIPAFKGFDEVGKDPNTLVGAGLIDRGFTSTSLAASSDRLGSVELVIKLPKGAKAQYVGAHGLTGFREETEVLIQRGGKYRVTRFLGYSPEAKISSGSRMPRFELELVGFQKRK